MCWALSQLPQTCFGTYGSKCSYISQITKIMGSTSIRYRSDTFAADRNLIDIDRTVFPIWDHCTISNKKHSFSLISSTVCSVYFAIQYKTRRQNPYLKRKFWHCTHKKCLIEHPHRGDVGNILWVFVRPCLLLNVRYCESTVLWKLYHDG